jgi:hypothetical protein
MSLLAKPSRPEWTTTLALDGAGRSERVLHLATKLAGNVRSLGTV